MGNISYDPTKRSRSAAGTARTTPGVSGTTAAPRSDPNFRYGSVPQVSAPANSGETPGGGLPQWLQNRQFQFQSSRELEQRRERQNPVSVPSFGMEPSVAPSFASSLSSSTPPPFLTAPSFQPSISPSQQNGTAPSQQNGTAPSQQNGTAPSQQNGTAPSQQSNVSSFSGAQLDMQKMMQNPKIQDEFKLWLQQKYPNGLI